MAKPKIMVQDPKERTDIIISVIVVLFFGTLMYFFMRGDFRKQDLISHPSPEYVDQNLKTLNINQEVYQVEEIVPLEIDEKRREVIVVEKIANPSERFRAKREATLNRSRLIETEEKLIQRGDTLKNFSESTKKHSSMPAIQNDTIPSKNESIDTIFLEEAEKDPIDSEDTLVNDSKDVIRSASNCIIWIGRFASIRNASRIIDQLNSDEYRVFSEQRGDLTVVGINVSCDRNEERATLEKVRKKYNVEAVFARRK